MKKILIISYYFYPENTPRAFRTFELVQEFLSNGHKVDLIIPNNEFKYEDYFKNKNLTIIKTQYEKIKHIKNRTDSDNDRRKEKKIDIKEICKKIFYYFVSDKEFKYSYYVYKEIKKIEGKYDYLISIGLPFSVHFGSMLGIKNNKEIAKLKIADYGDPYYYNSYSNKAIYFKYLEKYTMNYFNFITIPTDKSINSYRHVNVNKVRIIPQGFNFEKIQLEKYQKKHYITFAYAGAFYRGIRDPRFFLDYLSNLDFDFKFYIYTHTNSRECMELISNYKDKLKDKLVINPIIPRLECIKELSKCDFLINIDNINTGQVPSKLIDYTLTRRPIYNFNVNNFKKEIFQEFLMGNYQHEYKLDINKYDIKNVAKQFLNINKL